MIPGKTEGWPGPPQLLIPDPVTVTGVTSQSEARTGGPGPIRGRQTVSHDQGQTTGARPLIYFDPRRPQTMTIFYLSDSLIICDCLASRWLSSLCIPVMASITLSNEVITAICGPITQQFLLFLQRSEISFLTSRFQSKYEIGVRQSSTICYTLLLLCSLFLNIVIMFSLSVESLGKSEQRSCDKKIIMPLAVKKWPWKRESHNLLIAERWAGDASEWELRGRSHSHPSGCNRHVWMTPKISKFRDENVKYRCRCPRQNKIPFRFPWELGIVQIMEAGFMPKFNIFTHLVANW